MGKRRFTDAPNAIRCTATVKLADGSEAQCGRRRVIGTLCTQHAHIQAKLSKATA